MEEIKEIDIKEILRSEMVRISEAMANVEPGTEEYRTLLQTFESHRKSLTEIEKLEIELDRQLVESLTAEKKADTDTARAKAEKAIATARLEFEQEKFRKEQTMEKVKVGVQIGGTVVAVAMSIWSVCYVTAMNLKGEIPDKVLSPVIRKMMDVFSNIHI